MLPDAISIGPALLSTRLLLIFAAGGGGLLAVWLLLGRERDALRREVVDVITTGALIGFAGWKLVALFTQFDAIRRRPLILLHASGGRIGVAVGALLVIGYVAWKYVVKRRSAVPPTTATDVDTAVAVKEIVPVLALTAAAALLIYGALFATTSIVYAAGGGAGHSARVGLPAPGFTLDRLPADHGEPSARASIADFAGKPVVVSFWATWCGPCGAEVVDRNRLAREFDGRAVVLGVNLTNTEGGVAPVELYARERGIAHPVLLDRDGRVADAYGVRGTPTTVIIAPDGTVHSRIFGVMSYDRVAATLRTLADG